VYLLREAFNYDYDAIADTVERAPANRRQIAVRARRHVEAHRPRFEASREARDASPAACRDGDAEGLLEPLSADCMTDGDGGGRVPAARAPSHGRERGTQALLGRAQTGNRVGARPELVTVNGQPGARFDTLGRRLISVAGLDIADRRVQTVRSIVNPDKVRHLGPLADLRELLSQVTGRR
jgi:RNA polymerase sigma-70 factor (ECF subfamily)